MIHFSSWNESGGRTSSCSARSCWLLRTPALRAGEQRARCRAGIRLVAWRLPKRRCARRSLHCLDGLGPLGTASPSEPLSIESADGELSVAKIVGCLYQVLREGSGNGNRGRAMADERSEDGPWVWRGLRTQGCHGCCKVLQ